MLKITQLVLSILFSMALLSCTPPPKTESLGEYIDSSTTTAKVKARLIDALGSDGLGIQVKTYKDEVQLSGFVNNALIKRHAGLVASRTMAVRRVRNNLIIK